MRVAIRDHQNKSAGLMDAIRRSHKLEYAPPGHYADVLLIDHDATDYYKKYIDVYKEIGAKVYLYPHGATAHLAWDGVWPVYDKVDGYLAMSEGQAETMRRYGYPKPVKVTGWHWCEQKAFKPAQGRKVLYAPIHVLGNGFIHADVRDMNTLVMERLCQLDIQLKVRYVGELDACGIEVVNDVEYVKGNADNSYRDIDQSDFVVSFGTFAYLAIARGKPTMMYRQEIPYFDGHSAETVKEAESWELYGDYMEYPINVLEDNAFKKSNTEQKDWRDLFIGDQITPERLEAALDA